MALAATIVFELRSGGNDLNGGGFNSAAAGVDYSQQTSPHVTIDGATITATVHTTTTQLNIVGYTVHANDVGNLLRISGGTATAGTYQINTADTVNNRWTVDRVAGTAAQTATGRMGGCRKFLGSLFASGTTPVAGNRVWWKNDGAFSITTATPGDGGPANIPSIGGLMIEGYETTRGDRGDPPVLDAGAQTGVTLIDSTATSNLHSLINIKVDGNGNATVTGFDNPIRGSAEFCQAVNCVDGFTGGAPLFFCLAEDCTSTGFGSGTRTIKCRATNCGIGYLNNTGGASVWIDSIADNNTGPGFSGGVGAIAMNCVAYGNGEDGFDTNTTSFATINCISVGNTEDGYETGTNAMRLFNCADFDNDLGRFNGTPVFDVGPITLTGDPFTNAGGDDFTLNDIAGAGAACRAAGLVEIGSEDFPDIGAFQHEASGSTGWYAGE